MAVTYKDIDLLSNKTTLSGSEKIPVSDTQYVTTNQVAGLAGASGKADKVSSATNGDFAGLDSNGNLTDSGKKDSDFVHTTGNETIAGTKYITGALDIASDNDALIVGDTAGFDWIVDDNGDSVQNILNAKQATLVSGTNIKTVNNQSLLGSGNIDARDIKIVEYGDEQVWSDIVTAYSTKAVYCRIDENPDIYTIPLTYLDTSGVALFIGPVQSIGSIYWATVDDNDRWEQGNFVPQSALVSGTNIKTINNESILGSGNITVGGGSTTDCVHKTGDESVGGDKTFTDDIAVVDASHIKYSGGGGGGGFTQGHGLVYLSSAANSISFTGLSGEPKAFVVSDTFLAGVTSSGVLSVVGDSTGCHGIYTTGSQHNYSAGFSKSYSNGTLTVTAPTGVNFAASAQYSIIYYYGDGTLTFHTSTIQPGSGVTSVTFTGTPLTETPTIYACMLETQVNVESYRRVACYTNAMYDEDLESQQPIAHTFFTSNPAAVTTSSFTVTYQTGYQAGLNINSGGTNAGGYFHNPGTYTLYYLMASDVGSGGGGGGFQSLGDELDDIRDTIGDIATILASI